MRLNPFRRRREPQVLVQTPEIRAYVPDVESACALLAEFKPKEEQKMTAEARKGRILRSATKRQPRTAGELAVRSGLAAADGSGRGISQDIGALVDDGQLVRHGRVGHYSYTRAA